VTTNASATEKVTAQIEAGTINSREKFMFDA
jgi:hypothetical protein